MGTLLSLSYLHLSVLAIALKLASAASAVSASASAFVAAAAPHWQRVLSFVFRPASVRFSRALVSVVSAVSVFRRVLQYTTACIGGLGLSLNLCLREVQFDSSWLGGDGPPDITGS